MNLTIKVSGDNICFDICGKDTMAGLKDKVEAQLKDKYIEEKIEFIVCDYIEDAPEEFGYRYIFNEDSLKEFVVKMIDEVNMSEDNIKEKSSDIVKQVGEKMSFGSTQNIEY